MEETKTKGDIDEVTIPIHFACNCGDGDPWTHPLHTVDDQGALAGLAVGVEGSLFDRLDGRVHNVRVVVRYVVCRRSSDTRRSEEAV